MLDVALLFSDSNTKEEVEHLSQRIELLLGQQGNIKKGKYKDHKTLVNHPAIVVFHDEEIDDLEVIVGERNQKILIAITHPRDVKFIKDFHHVRDRIYGFIDLSQEDIYNMPIISNYLTQLGSFDQASLANLSNDLSSILAQTMKELDRVKEIHQAVVPMREFKLKGIHSVLKFLSGERPGGEFFDSVLNEGEQWSFYVRSHSYVVASLLISEIESLKAEKNIATKVNNFFEILAKMQLEYKTQIECAVTRLDTKSLKLEVWNQSSGEFFVDGNSAIQKNINKISSEELKCEEVKLKPETKLIFLSSGLRQVYSASFSDYPLNSFVKDHYKLAERDFLNELFYKIKSKNIGMFLPYDSLACVTYIDANSLFQIN